MADGVVETTVPVANDIFYGEFKAYYNYGLPTQLLIGVTQGGCKVDIERVIEEIKMDGAYGPCLDSSGIPLIRTRELIGRVTLESLLIKYYNRKVISNCESGGTWENNDWSATGGTYAAETTIVNSGDQSSKMTAGTSQYGIHEVFTSSKDLTAFDNSETSDTADKIGFAIYISTQDLTDLGSADLRVSFHMDAEGTETNYYYYDVAASALTADQWTTFTVAKSAFTETGTGDWSAVTGVSMKLDAAPSAEVVCYIDSIDLIQTHSYSAPVALNGTDLYYSDETTYREIKQDLAIEDEDYIDNLTIMGQKHDGKKMKIVMKNCLNDGAVSMALEEKKEVVNSTQYTGHYSPNSMTTPPIKIYEYIS